MYHWQTSCNLCQGGRLGIDSVAAASVIPPNISRAIVAKDESIGRVFMTATSEKVTDECYQEVVGSVANKPCGVKNDLGGRDGRQRVSCGCAAVRPNLQINHLDTGDAQGEEFEETAEEAVFLARRAPEEPKAAVSTVRATQELAQGIRSRYTGEELPREGVSKARHAGMDFTAFTHKLGV
eukprot:5655032-Amphidinium_carterae.1